MSKMMALFGSISKPRNAHNFVFRQISKKVSFARGLIYYNTYGREFEMENTVALDQKIYLQTMK
jgi:hypothetical protein